MASELRTRIFGGAMFGVVVLAMTLWSFWSFAGMCAVAFVILMKEWWGLTKQRSRWWLLIGILYIGLAIVSLIFLRSGDSSIILALLVLVWTSDVAAYFVGKPFGKHKIAPSISPGKSWEGLAGAVLACAILGFAFTYYGEYGQMRAHVENFRPTLLRESLIMAALAAPFAVIGFLGDLFESYLKRKAGVKDSGNLIPGHGGLFDRVDALLPCAIYTVLFVMGRTLYEFTR